MAIFRIEKNKDYTVMSNYHFKEKNMTLKAKGLLSLMLSLPNDWDYSINGLIAICKENETSIRNTLEELKIFGYLKITKLLPNQTESGRIEYEYIIYEKPKQEGKKQGVENLGVENLGVENQGQLNTNKLNTNNNINIGEKNSADKNPLTFTMYGKEITIEEMALEIYKEYPRKEGKADAIKHIIAYLKGTKKVNNSTYKLSPEQIVNAIMNYTQNLEETGKIDSNGKLKKDQVQYVLQASTFFNGRLLDYLEEE